MGADDASQGSDPKGKKSDGIMALIATLSEALLGVDITDSDSFKMPESPLTDFNHAVWSGFESWRVFAFFVYQATFIALIIYFIYSAYHDGVTQSFISLDKTSGVCKDDSSSTTCCEVPQTITGTFLADTQGRWNTQNNFSYINNNYAITVAGLEYTNAQWAEVMKNITDQLSVIGLKGENRDLAWNMVAWASFTAQNLERGFLQFYATGTPGVMYNKPLLNKGVASATSQKTPCNKSIDTSYSASTATLDVSIDLCDSDEGCPYNPCPGILAPQAMGYDTLNSLENTLDLSISMVAVSTALAVNLGMTKLNHLVMIPGDNDRITLLNSMVSQGAIDLNTANHTSSYFDERQAPTPPIYCYSANAPPTSNSNTWVSGDAFCLVRIGNTLAYPVTTSYGWSNDGKSYPTKCSKEAASVSGTAAKYYCNKFNINVGLIYYPVPNQDPSYVWTYPPTVAPTERPTPPPGAPTIRPTKRPSARPTRLPTKAPTPRPGQPTLAPVTARPSKKPTRAPTAPPTPVPTTARRLSEKELEEALLAAGDPTPDPTPEPTVAPTEATDDGAGDDGAGDDGAGDDGAGDDGAGDDGAGDDGAAYNYNDDGGGAYYGGGDYGGGDDDNGAADDQYATYGIGTYSSPYYANSATDDFTPLVPVVVDNGYIFNLGKLAAAELNKVNASNGDLFMPNNAYYAMVDTVVGLKGNKKRSFSKDFNTLCSSSVAYNIQPGCAMMAFNFDATNARDISIYYYQPSSTPAFSNTLYAKNELIALQKNTPTSLIQTYYSCVLAPWPAFLAAVGIGSSSASVFLTVGFAFYVFVTILILNRFYGANIPSKKAMEAKAEAEAELRAQELEVARRVIDALKNDVASGRVNLPCVSEAFAETEKDLRQARAAAAEAGVQVPSTLSSKGGAPSAPIAMMEVEMNPMRGGSKA